MQMSYKPGSVEDSHLSRSYLAVTLHLPTLPYSPITASWTYLEFH
jgi:hypothetical protein